MGWSSNDEKSWLIGAPNSVSICCFIWFAGLAFEWFWASSNALI